MIAKTPPPPYYAVIFTSIRSEMDPEEYANMADRMAALAAEQPGYLGAESVRAGLGITVSYWESLDAIRHWKANAEHLVAQRLGRERWYAAFTTRICKVERDYRLD